MTPTDTRPLPPVPTSRSPCSTRCTWAAMSTASPSTSTWPNGTCCSAASPAGKSSGLNLIVAHGALSCDCKLILVDGKQVELGMWRACADEFIGPSITDAIAAFERFQGIMNDRYRKLLATGRRKIARDAGEDIYLIPIDEYAYFSATVGTKPQRETFAGLSRDLVARGRAAGVIPRPGHPAALPSGHRPVHAGPVLLPVGVPLRPLLL